MTTCGYGDFNPQTFNEKLFQIFIMIISQCIFAYIIGCISNIISYTYDFETEFTNKIMTIGVFLTERGIDEDLRFKIKTYLENELRTKLETKINEFEILGMVNKSLKEQIVIELNGLIISMCDIYFGGYEGSDKVCILLTSLIKDETIIKNDIIF